MSEEKKEKVKKETSGQALTRIANALEEMIDKRCKHCGMIKNYHCGGQHWCYDNYHSKNPTKFTPSTPTPLKEEDVV